MADKATEFEPITSQEQFDQAIKSRIERAQAKAVEKFADYDELKAKAGLIASQIDTAPKRIDDSTAHDVGLITSQIDTAPKLIVALAFVLERLITSQIDTALKRLPRL